MKHLIYMNLWIIHSQVAGKLKHKMFWSSIQLKAKTTHEGAYDNR